MRHLGVIPRCAQLLGRVTGPGRPGSACLGGGVDLAGAVAAPGGMPMRHLGVIPRPARRRRPAEPGAGTPIRAVGGTAAMGLQPRVARRALPRVGGHDTSRAGDPHLPHRARPAPAAGPLAVLAMTRRQHHHRPARHGPTRGPQARGFSHTPKPRGGGRSRRVRGAAARGRLAAWSVGCVGRVRRPRRVRLADRHRRHRHQHGATPQGQTLKTTHAHPPLGLATQGTAPPSIHQKPETCQDPIPRTPARGQANPPTRAPLSRGRLGRGHGPPASREPTTSREFINSMRSIHGPLGVGSGHAYV